MNVLAIDTCFGACSVAVGLRLGSDATSSVGAFEPLQTGHAEKLMPMVAKVMGKASAGFADLDRIVVTTGPGTFTGTRIGVSASRGLALAAGLPLVGLSSLAVIAKSPQIDRQCDTATAQLAIVVDARRGQVYAQLFDLSATSEKTPPMLLTVTEAAMLGGDGAMVFAGSAAETVAAAALALGREAVAQCTDLQPDIADYIPAAANLTPATIPVKPLYLRPPDAKAQTDKSIERAT